MTRLIEGGSYIIDITELCYTQINIKSLPICAELGLILLLKYEKHETSRSLYHITSPKVNYTYNKYILLSSLEQLYTENRKKITELGTFCYTYLKKLSDNGGLIWIDNRIMIEKGQPINLQLKLF